MANVFLIQSVDTDTFHKLAKEGEKVDDFDCYALVVTNYACNSYQKAVIDCREYNREQTSLRYFVKVVLCY